MNWLLRENELVEGRARLLRNAREEEEMLLMSRPVAARQAFATFGLLLGTFPPAAIFYRIFGESVFTPYVHFNFPLLLLLFVMNVACALAGCYFGAKLSRLAADAGKGRWPLASVEAASVGFLWGAATGAAGGFPAYGVGAIFGLICAVPVGMLAFALFVPLHRLLARGGMIDARHLWPLACGVALSISALILRM